MRPLPILLLTVGYFAVAVMSYSQVAAEDADASKPCTVAEVSEARPRDRANEITGAGAPATVMPVSEGTAAATGGGPDCSATATP